MPVEPEEGQYLQLGAWGYLHPYFQHPHSQPLPTSVCPLPALPVWPLLGSGGGGGGPGNREGAWMPGAGGMSSALQDRVGLAKQLPWRGAVPQRGEGLRSGGPDLWWLL